MKTEQIGRNFYSIGPNNLAVSGSMDGCGVSAGPNSFAESVSIVDGSDSIGSNSFGDSDGVDVFLDGESEVTFL